MFPPKNSVESQVPFRSDTYSGKLTEKQSGKAPLDSRLMRLISLLCLGHGFRFIETNLGREFGDLPQSLLRIPVPALLLSSPKGSSIKPLTSSVTVNVPVIILVFTWPLSPSPLALFLLVGVNDGISSDSSSMMDIVTREVNRAKTKRSLISLNLFSSCPVGRRSGVYDGGGGWYRKRNSSVGHCSTWTKKRRRKVSAVASDGIAQSE